MSGVTVLSSSITPTRSCNLQSRYWKITDENGIVDEVRGPGVVGEQPVLGPGDTYEYSSGCPLDTPSGVMVGTYQMQSAAGELFDVEIPAFSLDLPGMARTLN
jgi:ApaG protein